MARPTTAFIIGAILLSAAPARAQDVVNVYLMDGGAFNNALNASTLASRTRALLGDQAKTAPDRSAKPSPGPSTASAKALRFTSTPGATAIPAMAATYPADKQGEVTSVFKQLLGKFGQIERMFGQPDHDLPTALSLYVATSYEAVTGAEVTPQQARPLIAQMHGLLEGEPGIAGASDVEKQKLYERLAITGMFTSAATLELKQKPDPVVSEKLKASARANLAQLGLDAARIQFGDQGLSTK
jgi:hypothetical protein